VANKRRKKKRNIKRDSPLSFLRTPAVIITVLGLILLSAQALVDLYEQEIIQYALNTLEKKSGGMYKIRYGKGGLNLLKGGLFLENLTIKSDMGLMKNQALEKSYVETLQPVSVRLEGLFFPGLVFGGGIRSNECIISGGRLRVNAVPPHKTDQEEKKAKKSSSLPLIKLDRLFIDNVCIQVNRPDQGERVLSLPRIQAALEGFKLWDQKGARKFELRSGTLELENPQGLVSRGFYTLQAKTVLFSKNNNCLRIDDLELIPRYGKYEFSRRRGYRTSRISLKIPVLECIDMDPVSFNCEKSLHCGLVRVSKPVMEIFRDRNLARRRARENRTFPQQLLAKLGFKLAVDNLELHQGVILYEERGLSRVKSGLLPFSQVDLKVRNLANHPGLLKQQGDMELDLSALIMDKSPLQVKLVAPLTEENPTFTISGSLGRTHLRNFNTFLTRNAHMRIETGVIQKVYFNFDADARQASGEMRAFYGNLKVSLFKKEGTSKKRKFVSFLANTIIHRNNSNRDGKFRVGLISFEPEESMPFLGYVFKSLLSGVKSSIGLKKSKKIDSGDDNS